MKKNVPSELIFKARELDISLIPKIDCHLHTSWTDGKGTVAEVYDAAISAGLSTILFSEHSRRTSNDWFYKFASEVRALPQSPCRAYVGTECKIESFDGSIDTNNSISDLCDFIMASVHRFPDGNGGGLPFDSVSPINAINMEFDLSWAALSNPKVQILGHIFGMSLRRFNAKPAMDLYHALIARAVEFNVAIEINSHYHNNPLELFAWCQEYDAYVTFGSNAHQLSEVGRIIQVMNRGANL